METQYADIERQLLTAVYGCEHFRTYHFCVESDYKHLESIHLKHLITAPPTLQRMLLKIIYKPGKEMLIADVLSQLSIVTKKTLKNMDIQIHDFCSQFTTAIGNGLKTDFSQRQELNILKEGVYSGSPENPREVSVAATR